MAQERIRNNKEERPLAYYLEKYRSLDPVETAARCALPYDAETGCFCVHFLGCTYRVAHPAFCADGEIPLTNAERMLLLRYLTEGQYGLSGGRYLSYREFPWAAVYEKQFDGRCVKRLAFTYGAHPEKLRRALAGMPAEPVGQGDVGYAVTLLPGLTVRLLLWLADEEFPPSAQILFSDNFRYAFSAEDMAVIGDVLLERLKRMETIDGVEPEKAEKK